MSGHLLAKGSRLKTQTPRAPSPKKALAPGWTVVSIKWDWKRVFPYQKLP